MRGVDSSVPDVNHPDPRPTFTGVGTYARYDDPVWLEEGRPHGGTRAGSWWGRWGGWGGRSRGGLGESEVLKGVNLVERS